MVVDAREYVSLACCWHRQHTAAHTFAAVQNFAQWQRITASAQEPTSAATGWHPTRLLHWRAPCKPLLWPAKASVPATSRAARSTRALQMSASRRRRRCDASTARLCSSAPGATDCLTAVILDPETVFQQDSAGVPFPEVLSKQGLIPGVKPSLTVYKLPGTAGETTMQGLDGLSERCAKYYAAGCRFAKWRSPLTIDVAAGTPSALAIETNCRDLARYALICQSEGLVPIVEPDLVLKGAHSLEDAVEANARVLGELVRGMQDYGVHLPGTLLKTNFVNCGKDLEPQASFEEIADARLRVLRRVLPVAVASVNYLSGGLSLDVGLRPSLSALNKLKRERGGDRYAPWNLSFSWSSCIQLPLFDLCKTEAKDESGLPRAAIQKLYVLDWRGPRLWAVSDLCRTRRRRSWESSESLYIKRGMWAGRGGSPSAPAGRT